MGKYWKGLVGGCLWNTFYYFRVLFNVNIYHQHNDIKNTQYFPKEYQREFQWEIKGIMYIVQ